MYEIHCFGDSKSTPLHLCFCTSRWLGVFTGAHVPPRHNSMAGVWLKQSYAEVVGCFADPSLSVSQRASLIMREQMTRPPSPADLSLQHSASPDLNGGITVHMMSSLKTTDQKQCLIIAQGHSRLSIPMSEINGVMKNAFVFKHVPQSRI